MFFGLGNRRTDDHWSGIVEGRHCQIDKEGYYYKIKVEDALPSLIGYPTFEDAMEGCRKDALMEEDLMEIPNGSEDYGKEATGLNSIAWDNVYKAPDKVAKHMKLRNGNILQVIEDGSFYDISVLNPLEGFIYEDSFNDEEEALRVCRNLIKGNI